MRSAPDGDVKEAVSWLVHAPSGHFEIIAMIHRIEISRVQRSYAHDCSLRNRIHNPLSTIISLGYGVHARTHVHTYPPVSPFQSTEDSTRASRCLHTGVIVS